MQWGNGNPLQKASVYVYQSFRKLLGSPEARTDTIYKKLVYVYQAFRKLLLGSPGVRTLFFVPGLLNNYSCVIQGF